MKYKGRLNRIQNEKKTMHTNSENVNAYKTKILMKIHSYKLG